MQTEYVVVRSFHLGEAKLYLSAGEKVQFDGKTMIREKTGDSFSVPSLKLAIQARHIVQNTGDVEFKPRTEVLNNSTKPVPRLIVEDQEDRVVAVINVESRNLSATRPAPTEAVARQKAETAPKHILLEDQRVVGKANVRHSKVGTAIVGVTEAQMEAQQQALEAQTVRKINRSQMVLNSLMREEGILDKNDMSSNVIADASDGQIVGRIKSLDERKAELQTVSTVVEPVVSVEQAAKNIKTASGSPKIELDDLGYPVGYPRNEHWKVRLQWCIDRADQVEIIQFVFDRGTSGFKNQLKITFPTIEFKE